MATYSLVPITISGVSGSSFSVSVTGTFTYSQVLGVNDAGVAFGEYYDASGYHGFLDSGGAVTTISVAGSNYTQLVGVDAVGDAYGYYSDASGWHGFVDSGDGHVVMNQTDQAAQDISVITAPVGGAFRTNIDPPNVDCSH